MRPGFRSGRQTQDPREMPSRVGDCSFWTRHPSHKLQRAHVDGGLPGRASSAHPPTAPEFNRRTAAVCNLEGLYCFSLWSLSSSCDNEKIFGRIKRATADARKLWTRSILSNVVISICTIHHILVPCIYTMKYRHAAGMAEAFHRTHIWPKSSIPDYDRTVKRLEWGIAMLDVRKRARQNTVTIEIRMPVTIATDAALDWLVKVSGDVTHRS